MDDREGARKRDRHLRRHEWACHGDWRDGRRRARGHVRLAQPVLDNPAGRGRHRVTGDGVRFGFIEGPKWGFTSWPILGCFALFVIGSWAFLLAEQRSKSPLVPLSIFRGSAFSAGLADATLMTFGMYGLLFVLPLFLQAVKGDPSWGSQPS